MAEYNCAACEEIRQKDPNLIVNGFGDTECNYLKNDTGIDGSSDDCTDLGLLNDCLVGNMADEIDSYDVCDWKDYMKKFVPNVWTVFKAIICAICGIWTNIHKINCTLDYIMQGARFSFGEYTDSGNSYIVAGKGVSFANVSSSGTSSDITITYVAGGIGYLSGSCLFYNSNFTDAKSVANYDNGGVNPTTSASRRGNSAWDESGYLGNGGELIFELRIKKSEYPQISRFWNGLGMPGAGGAYELMVVNRGEGTYAPGQSGWCDTSNGDPVGEGSDRGHLVPTGWMYIQVRAKYLHSFNAAPTQYTPVCLIPMRVNENGIDC